MNFLFIKLFKYNSLKFLNFIYHILHSIQTLSTQLAHLQLYHNSNTHLTRLSHS